MDAPFRGEKGQPSPRGERGKNKEGEDRKKKMSSGALREKRRKGLRDGVKVLWLRRV